MPKRLLPDLRPELRSAANQHFILILAVAGVGVAFWSSELLVSFDDASSAFSLPAGAWRALLQFPVILSAAVILVWSFFVLVVWKGPPDASGTIAKLVAIVIGVLPIAAWFLLALVPGFVTPWSGAGHFAAFPNPLALLAALALGLYLTAACAWYATARLGRGPTFGLVVCLLAVPPAVPKPITAEWQRVNGRAATVAGDQRDVTTKATSRLAASGLPPAVFASTARR